MKGRKPFPAETHLKKGRTRPDQVNYREPIIPEPASLAPPTDLKGAGLHLWTQNLEMLTKAGHLRAADMPLFTQWCRVGGDIARHEKRNEDSAMRHLIP